MERIKVNYPPDLPISEHRDELLDALRRHQVVVVCGDTGSGKTTQLPKMALELGFGAEGRMIACTQPRRLAAVTVAQRVAAEFGQEVGRSVGYQHRFDRRLSRDTRIKFMTDGVLLAEIKTDRQLRRYDALIIDEAHERSLNIDLLLGWIKRILPRRPDLKLIISSATIDTARFAEFFGNAPVVRVPGRLYPIQMEYWQPDEEEPDLPVVVAGAVDRLAGDRRGDILVFLPGERDIRETAEVLEGRRLLDTDIIPLLASLPAAAQQRAFRVSAKRRIILATNVAETSVTIPGIRYVIDSGLARISRYSHRTQVQKLQIEAVSQASANQRAGRCGRIGPGVCIRLYSEEDFKKRPEFTDPEIKRSSLSGVILTMLHLRLGDISEFDFLDAPAAGLVREGLRELHELGAVREKPRGGVGLTDVGWKLAAMPVAPRLGRMLLEADKEKSLKPALTVVAALAAEEPRRRPLEKQTEADLAHRQWAQPDSDFAMRLALYNWWERETEGRSRAVARRLCEKNYLSYNKMREWLDLHRQLLDICRQTGMDTKSESGGGEGLHRALLAGLLAHIGRRDSETRDYRGTNGIRFAIFPGSGVARRPPDWLMAAELVDTARLFARGVAKIDVRWVEPLARHLCSYSYHSPIWDEKAGFVRVTERVTLNGLVIVEGRRRDYTRINPEFCRDLFIRHALVDGEFPNPPPLLRDNQTILDHIRTQEEKSRQVGGLLDVEKLVEWFDQRVPQRVASAVDFRRWLKGAPSSEREVLRLVAEEWLVDEQVGFPDFVELAGEKLPLMYRHSYGEEDDGITCRVKPEQIELLRRWPADWLVPGMLPEKVQWMLANLPAAQRRIIGPLPEATSRCLTHIRPEQGRLSVALAASVSHNFGIRVDSDIWEEERLPAHLRVRFEVVDGDGRVKSASRFLDDLMPLAPETQAKRMVDRWHMDGLTEWTCGELPERIADGEAGWELVSYPALVDGGNSVSLRVFDDPAMAAGTHRGGVLRLLRLALAREIKRLPAPSLRSTRISQFLRQIEYPEEKLLGDLNSAVVAAACLDGQNEIRGPMAFDLAVERGGRKLAAVHHEWRMLVMAVLEQAAGLHLALERCEALPEESVDDLYEQLAWLAFPGFIALVGWENLQHYPRYFTAMERRLDKMAYNQEWDRRHMRLVMPYWKRYLEFVISGGKLAHKPVELGEYRWLVEEYRVSCFAQELGTARPVSPKRLDAKWRDIWEL